METVCTMFFAYAIILLSLFSSFDVELLFAMVCPC